jgi:hypothetical protein
MLMVVGCRFCESISIVVHTKAQMCCNINMLTVFPKDLLVFALGLLIADNDMSSKILDFSRIAFRAFSVARRELQ